MAYKDYRFYSYGEKNSNYFCIIVIFAMDKVIFIRERESYRKGLKVAFM